tara:strand:+ start:369 stop:674 length:306 start_codon:yes stop_codon:yes gene_type:complete
MERKMSKNIKKPNIKVKEQKFNIDGVMYKESQLSDGQMTWIKMMQFLDTRDNNLQAEIEMLDNRIEDLKRDILITADHKQKLSTDLETSLKKVIETPKITN